MKSTIERKKASQWLLSFSILAAILLSLEADNEPRVVEIPSDLQDALQANPAAGVRFSKLSYSHKKEYVDHIQAAATPDTRARRIVKTIASLNEGK